MKTRDDKRKISVKMWGDLLGKLNELCTAACLNRDAYLDVVLAYEAGMLTSELAGRRNTDAARSYVKRCFLGLPEHRVASFNLRVSTADAVDAACEEANIWRDVFINRVAYLLVARTKTLETQWDLCFNDYREEIFDDGFDIKGLLLGPKLVAIGGFIRDDPFLGMRTALRQAFPDSKGALHSIPLGVPGSKKGMGRGLLGLSTYLEDASVPGTEANVKQQAWVKELLDSLREENEPMPGGRKAVTGGKRRASTRRHAHAA